MKETKDPLRDGARLTDAERGVAYSDVRSADGYCEENLKEWKTVSILTSRHPNLA